MSATAKVLTPEPAVLRHDLNGLIMRIPGQDAQYLIIGGYKCHIPNMETAYSLFVPNYTITPDPNLNDITTGNPITDGAVLAQAEGTPGKYLISAPPGPLNAPICIMGITTPAIFERYQFNNARVVVVPLVFIEGIPAGPAVPPPTP